MNRKKWILAGIGLLGLILVVAGIWMSRQPTEPESGMSVVQERSPVGNTTRSAEPAGPDQAQTGSEGPGSDLQRAEQQEQHPPKVAEKIKPDLMDDMAQFVLAHYTPAAGGDSGPQLNLSFKALNTQYGLKLEGLNYEAGRISDGRREVLKAFMQPQIIKVSRQFFGPRFIRELVDVGLNQGADSSDPGGQTTSLGPKDIEDLLQRLGARVRQWGELVSVFASHPALFDKTQALNQAEEAVFEANFAFEKASAEFDRLGQGAEGRPDLKESLESAGAAYKEAISVREGKRQELVKALHQALPQTSMQETEVLYLAKWLQRRRQEGLAKREVLESLGSNLKDYAETMTRQAHELKGLDRDTDQSSKR